MSKSKLKSKPINPDNGVEAHDETGNTGMSDILNELRAFRNETSENFVTLRNEIGDLRNGLGEVTKRVDAAEERLSANEDNERNITRVMLHMLQEQSLLKEKCESLESHSRRNNIRIYAVPEKTEGNNITAFVTNLLLDQLGVTEAHIERAHRVGPPAQRPGQSERPRSIVVKFRNYITKHSLLKAAWTKKTVQVNGTRIYFDEDFTPEIYKERGQYRFVRKVLRERKIKYHILYPAKLKIFLEDGKSKTFKNPVAAAQGLLEFGITMSMPSVEPDLWSTLRASGWHTAGPR
ncbi:unnamed protein product [Knipowitschia caucasica]